MWAKNWWLSTLDRVLKTAAQTFIALTGGDSVGFFDVSWNFIGINVAGMSLLSFAFCILSTPLGRDKGDPQIL